MIRLTWRQLALSILALALSISEASAHCFVGARFMPATLTIDDPCVADELSLPTIAGFKNSDDPAARELDISGEFSKRITENFGLSIEGTWTRLHLPDGAHANGFQNLETTFKYQLVTDPGREFIFSLGLGVEWGGTGAESVGAERVSSITPTLFVGKGFGDLSTGWLRPFAVTGQLGYTIPSQRSTTDDLSADIEINPDVLVWGVTLQYSFPYLHANVVDLGLPDFFNHLIPIVEASFETPVSHTLTSGTITTGTINPGVIWIGNKYQVGLEAIIPINRESGGSVGAIAQLHFYLDDIFPDSLGKPLFSAPITISHSNYGH
jgi:hypothetical protein